MEVENTLAKSITAAGEKASYDAACKKLLANKMILAWIMKSCLDEYRACDVHEIAENYIEGTPQIGEVAVNPDEAADAERIRGVATEDSSIGEGTITYDIRFLAAAPVSGERMRLIINVEAQNDFYPGYPIIKRGIYYCSRMISAQYGTEFTDAHYEKIKKVYSIWICMNPPKKRRNSINRYSIREENLVGDVREKRGDYDLLTAVMICLGDAEGENYSGILKLLEVLLSAERGADEKKRILQEDFSIQMTRELEREVLTMCNLSKGVEERGIEKGIEKGIVKGVLLSLKNLMNSTGWSAERAMNALQIPTSEQAAYAEELKK
ncbi:MAG: hypothetical protein Q4F41_06990 [Eubacteriales bacterium]|nr:hypothetical protein [Eubacteriales bacterium]